MTDPMDELLNDAGRRWRAAQPTPPEPDSSRWVDRTNVPDRSGWLPVLAAAGAAAVVAVGAVVVAAVGPDPGGPDTPAVVALASGPPPAADLVVRDGDRVRASGTVVAAPGQPVRFCAPAPTTLALRQGDAGIPDCTFGVPVTGVDLGGLTGVTERAGVRFGTATLTGVWQAGTLQVTGQGAPTPTTTPSSPALPCQPPAGGWRATGPVDGAQLHRYVEQEHPDRFRRPWVSYPNGPGTGATPGSDAVQVIVVEVVRGDVDEARRELRQRYQGNLCIVRNPGAKSLADQLAMHGRVQAALDPVLRDRTNGVFAAGGADTVTVDLVVLTPRLYDGFAAIGLDALELRPWLLPVG